MKHRKIRGRPDQGIPRAWGVGGALLYGPGHDLRTEGVEPLRWVRPV